MMGTPQNLRDFAVGFSLSEGIVASPDDITSLDIVELDDGIELRMWLASSQAERISERRRQIAGPHRDAHLRHRLDRGGDPARRIGRTRPLVLATRDHDGDGRQSHRCRRSISRTSRGALRLRSGRRPAASSPCAEDVGRHNAPTSSPERLRSKRLLRVGETAWCLLTKPVSGRDGAKAAAMGAPLMVAVSAPTALAVRMADAAGLTLAAIARSDGFEIFTHPERIASIQETSVAGAAHVA